MAPIMTDEQKELLGYVLEDLQLLREDFGGDSFMDNRIRNASSILNKLFNENNFFHAWRICFGYTSQPEIIAPRLEYFIKADYAKSIVNAVAGGAHLHGIVHAIGMQNIGNKTVNVPDTINPIEHKYKLKAYFESGGLILNRVPISRFNIIKYVANKAGGKHIDFKLKEKPEFVALKEGKDVFNYFGKNAINVELHSMIQLIVNSPDTIRLEEKIKALLHSESK